jgi:hypothetical protein
MRRTPIFRGPFFEINPTAGPGLLRPAATIPHAPHAPAHAPEHAPVVCAPAPASVGGAAIEIHEPKPGQHVDITVALNQALILDFNPLDAPAVRHGDDLTLTFADGGLLVLHHIAQNGYPLPTALQLPDGTIINPCELLQALPEEQPNPTAGTIPEEKIPQPNPEAGPEQPNPAAGPGAPPVTTPFDVPGLGEGLNSLGPLGPETFTTTSVIFPPPGSGHLPPGSPPPSTRPNNPPPNIMPFSLPFLITFEDSNSGVVPNLVDNPGQTTLTITGNFLTDLPTAPVSMASMANLCRWCSRIRSRSIPAQRPACSARSRSRRTAPTPTRPMSPARRRLTSSAPIASPRRSISNSRARRPSSRRSRMSSLSL